MTGVQTKGNQMMLRISVANVLWCALVAGVAAETPAVSSHSTVAREVPADAPADAVMATSSECAEAGVWAAAEFAGKPVTTAKPTLDLLFGSAGSQPPFSFLYHNVPSANLLKGWKHTAQVQYVADRTVYTARWTDPVTSLCVSAVATAYKRYPAVEWVLDFENQGKQDTPILEDIQAVDVLLATPSDAPAILHRIAGDNCTADSFQPLEIAVEPHKPVRMAPVGGRSSSGTFPFFNFTTKQQGLFVAIGWTGQWASTLERNSADTTRLRAGMEHTHLILHPGERIRTPRILLMAYRGDLTAAHNRFRRLLIHHYCPKVDGRVVMLPAFLQCYDRYHGRADWPTEAGQLAYAKMAKEVGAEFTWLDAAWFPGEFPNGCGQLDAQAHVSPAA